MRRRLCIAYSSQLGSIELIPESGGQAMADNDQTEEGAPAAEPAPPRRASASSIIIAAALLLASVAGAATWFFFFRHHGEEVHAEAPPPKPPVFLDVPEILVNLAGSPGERVQYLKIKVVLEVKDEPLVEQIKPTMPRVMDMFQTYLRELRADRSQRLGGAVPPEGRTDAARQRGDLAQPGERGAVQGNRHSVTGRISEPWLADDQVDQDALAAQWEASLDSEDPVEAAEGGCGQ